MTNHQEKSKGFTKFFYEYRKAMIGLKGSEHKVFEHIMSEYVNWGNRPVETSMSKLAKATEISLISAKRAVCSLVKNGFLIQKKLGSGKGSLSLYSIPSPSEIGKRKELVSSELVSSQELVSFDSQLVSFFRNDTSIILSTGIKMTPVTGIKMIPLEKIIYDANNEDSDALGDRLAALYILLVIERTTTVYVNSTYQTLYLPDLFSFFSWGSANRTPPSLSFGKLLSVSSLPTHIQKKEKSLSMHSSQACIPKKNSSSSFSSSSSSTPSSSSKKNIDKKNNNKACTGKVYTKDNPTSGLRPSLEDASLSSASLSLLKEEVSSLRAEVQELKSLLLSFSSLSSEAEELKKEMALLKGQIASGDLLASPVTALGPPLTEEELSFSLDHTHNQHVTQRPLSSGGADQVSDTQLRSAPLLSGPHTEALELDQNFSKELAPVVGARNTQEISKFDQKRSLERVMTKGLQRDGSREMRDSSAISARIRGMCDALRELGFHSTKELEYLIDDSDGDISKIEGAIINARASKQKVGIAFLRASIKQNWPVRFSPKDELTLFERLLPKGCSIERFSSYFTLHLGAASWDYSYQDKNAVDNMKSRLQNYLNANGKMLT